MPLSKGQKKKAKAKRKQVRKDEEMAKNMSSLDKAHQLRDHLINTKYTDGTAESSQKAWNDAVAVHSRHFNKIDRLQFEMEKHQHLYDSNYERYRNLLVLAPLFKISLLSKDDIPTAEKKHLGDVMDSKINRDKCYLEHCKIMVEFWKESISVNQSSSQLSISGVDVRWYMYMSKCKEFHKRMLDNSSELDESYMEGVRLGVVTEEEYNTQMKAFASELSMMGNLALGEFEIV